MIIFIISIKCYGVDGRRNYKDIGISVKVKINLTICNINIFKNVG